MKISLAWLNSHLPPEAPATRESLPPTLTAQGFPVESVTDIPPSAVLPQGDVMFDVEVTSNRGDCLSHVGVAREYLAGRGTGLQPPPFDLPPATGGPVNAYTRVELQPGIAAACPLYTARLVTGVKVAPSPAWLAARLVSIGLRPINNVVDITNFVLHELGQPLHAFDFRKLAGQRLMVREANPGEKFSAIDGTRHELRPGMLVIADAQRAQAVAGIMGGADSEVDESTMDVLLESALFEPLGVRRTSRSLKLSSDSSYRFERGIDPAGVDRASRRAAALIVELAGGSLCEGVIRVGQPDPQPLPLALRVERCNALLGLSLTATQQAEYLQGLGLSPVVEGGHIHVTVPTFRLDLRREVDLIEEVARMYGMAGIPVKPKLEMVAAPVQDSVKARRALARVMVAHGYHETITFSFIKPALAQPFYETDASELRLAGDHKKDEPTMRPSLLPSLLQCRKLNQDAGNADVKLWETASTWQVVDGQQVEQVKLALLRDADDAEAALRALRGALDELVEALGGRGAAEALRVEPMPPDHDDVFIAGGGVTLDGKPLGVMGMLAPKLRSMFGVQSPLVAAELDLPALLALYPPRRSVGALPRFPGIERDLSIVIGEGVAWRDVRQAVDAAQPDKLERLDFVGIYRGKPIAKGQKSLTLRLCFRDPLTTLRHDQVDGQVASVLSKLTERIGATLRA